MAGFPKLQKSKGRNKGGMILEGFTATLPVQYKIRKLTSHQSTAGSEIDRKIDECIEGSVDILTNGKVKRGLVGWSCFLQSGEWLWVHDAVDDRESSRR